ncbi:MAG: hypothetical protein AUI50_07080 [Crenarchaeota archaeon 13_1_40CM_2_52_14]|nr:MAG: hypothetical protein AUI97_07680 [Crenarchaeota archaeon 13_1_40CM_3_52_17]OLD34317.1 MAG: hypothetical protein AUI50_07080 [Crenarchaeota archaeon 13_1_40CM_2_52_14]
MGQIPGRFGKTVKNQSKALRREILLKNKNTDEKHQSEHHSSTGITRRNFLKYGIGAAAVAAGATALMGKIPIPSEQPKTPAANDSSEPIVASVSGDELTVMNGQASVKVKDAGLAAQIADKLRAGK